MMLLQFAGLTKLLLLSLFGFSTLNSISWLLKWNGVCLRFKPLTRDLFSWSPLFDLAEATCLYLSYGLALEQCFLSLLGCKMRAFLSKLHFWFWTLWFFFFKGWLGVTRDFLNDFRKRGSKGISSKVPLFCSKFIVLNSFFWNEHCCKGLTVIWEHLLAKKESLCRESGLRDLNEASKSSVDWLIWLCLLSLDWNLTWLGYLDSVNRLS